ncbi:MAG: cupin domain-containing protein [Burkholderiales bacterium]|nr:cupin domain-containing protein [Burkholderiales bacterium]
MAEIPGITRANDGLDGVSWNILGQTYVPKQITEESFAWLATFPEESFTPPHMHRAQDEYILVMEGRIDLLLGGKRTFAAAGDLVRMPRGIPHAFYNNSGEVAKAMFWVAPTGPLVDLYRRIHNMSSPQEVVQVADEYGVHFFPPVSSAP